MISLDEIIEDPDFAQPFYVYRSTGSFIDGVWTESTPKRIQMYGVIVVANARELRMVPEGDRIQGAMDFYSLSPLYVTRTGQSQGTSDKILWRGDYYKLLSVRNWIDFGFYSATGERIAGD